MHLYTPESIALHTPYLLHPIFLPPLFAIADGGLLTIVCSNVLTGGEVVACILYGGC